MRFQPFFLLLVAFLFASVVNAAEYGEADFGGVDLGEHNFSLVDDLGVNHHKHSFAYSNFAENGMLLRKFVVSQNGPDGIPRLLDFHFEYLWEGRVATGTLRDIGYVVVHSGRMEIYFRMTSNQNEYFKAPLEETKVDSENYTKMLREIAKIEIELSESPKVTTHFHISNPRSTFLVGIDSRSRWDRLYGQEEEAVTETFSLDSELTNKIYAMGSARPRIAGELTGFGWYEEAKRQGLLTELPSSDTLSEPIDLSLEPDSSNAFVFVIKGDAFAEKEREPRFRRFLVSGNLTQLGQFLALVNLYSPDDFKQLLSFVHAPTIGDPLSSNPRDWNGEIVYFRQGAASGADMSIRTLMNENYCPLRSRAPLRIQRSCVERILGLAD